MTADLIWKYIIIILITVFLQVLIIIPAESAPDNFNKKIDLNLRDVELETAFMMLADLADINLICDKSVKGTITLQLKDVSFKDALTMIVGSFDLDYSTAYNTIFISTEDKIREKENTAVEKIFTLKYITAENAAELLKKQFEQIEFYELRNGRILMRGSDFAVKRCGKIIKEIDIPLKQVLITARVEEISRNKIKELGVQPDQLTKLNIIKDKNEKIEKLELSWPETLKMLEEKGAATLLANPSLMTVDRKKAKLLIGDQIPVKLERVESDKTVSTIEYIDAGIILEFLPRIINKKQIMLNIQPAVNSIGQTLSEGLPAVNSRKAETTVILEDGQTFAIGGLIKENIVKNKIDIPVISDIPVLGKLFSSEEKSEMHTELMIFITPKIIETKKIVDVNKTNKKEEINKDKQGGFSASKAETIIKKYKNKKESEKTKNNKKEFIDLTEKEIKELLQKQ
ncbi:MULTISPECIES: type II secretion system protein GspD [unclassified Halanaerobium]|uniref:type II secretion system protein GspD n=1 Tax=unclassified Halanaerobium TaxID=2641197 RepID=UPI000DF2A406|nr:MULTISPECIES: type II and III secretion system protein [unclassified Halanaerobium]RCW50532.1 type IV pilus assembly protein PilQ [Halanaerobium sp. MA284_MarDTE_T2]RCW86015.1 type IV pilus assembly protein PilQ [Halanaerobium sp. DL-01]